MTQRRTYKIRPIAASELIELVALWDDSGLPYRPSGRDSMRNLKAQRKADEDLFIGAFDGNEMLGAVIASDDGRKGWVNRLAVRPDARRKGMGQVLVAECEKVLRRRGRRLFCVHIEEENPESMELFEKIGYKREEHIFYYTKRELDSY